MSVLSSLTGGGGISGGDTSAKGGTSGVSSGTGAKTLNIGGNPNVTSGAALSLLIVAGIVLAVWLWRRGKS